MPDVEGLVYKVAVDPTTGVAGLKTFDRATAETETKTRRAAKGIEESIEKATARTSVMGRSMSGLDSMLGKITSTSLGTSAGLMGIGTKLGIIGASVTAAIYGVNRFMDAADRITDLTKGFDALTAKAGLLGDELLGRMSDGAEGFVSNADLMRAANLALVEELPITSDKMAQLVEQGVKLAKVVGQDETQAIQSLIEAAGRQSDRMLRTMGVSIDFDRVQKDLAKSLGVTVEMLTDGEKKGAFFEAELAGLTRATEGMSDDTLSLSDGWKAAWTHVKNFTGELMHAVNVGVPAILFGPDRFGSTMPQAGSELTPGLTLEEMRGAKISAETLRLMDQRLREFLKIPEASSVVQAIDSMKKGVESLRRELRATSDVDLRSVLGAQIQDLTDKIEKAEKAAGLLKDQILAVEDAAPGTGPVPGFRPVSAIEAQNAFPSRPTSMFDATVPPELGLRFGPADLGEVKSIPEAQAGPTILGQLSGIEDRAGGVRSLSTEFSALQTAMNLAAEDGGRFADIQGSIALALGDTSAQILAAAAAGDAFDPAVIRAAQDSFQFAEALRAIQGEALTFEGQIWSLITGSQAWGGALAAIQGHLGRTGAAFANMGGVWGRVGKVIQKIQAGMLLVEGIKGVRAGAIKVQEGIYPPNPALIASGVGMIAEGLAAIAQAKQLGASGGGGSTGGGGGGGAPSGSSSDVERIGAGRSVGREEGGSGQSEMYVPERERESRTTVIRREVTVNHNWNVQTLDGASFEDKVLKDPRWRRATAEAVAIEQG